MLILSARVEMGNWPLDLVALCTAADETIGRIVSRVSGGNLIKQWSIAERTCFTAHWRARVARLALIYFLSGFVEKMRFILIDRPSIISNQVYIIVCVGQLITFFPYCVLRYFQPN